MKTFLGATLIWVVARTESAVNPLLAGWLGMVGLIFVLHFGTFQLTTEGIDDPLHALEEARGARDIPLSRVRTLRFGESLRVE